MKRKKQAKKIKPQNSKEMDEAYKRYQRLRDSIQNKSLVSNLSGIKSENKPKSKSKKIRRDIEESSTKVQKSKKSKKKKTGSKNEKKSKLNFV